MDVLLSCTTFPTTFLWECSLAGLAKFQLAQFFKKVGKKELITNPFRPYEEISTILTIIPKATPYGSVFGRRQP